MSEPDDDILEDVFDAARAKADAPVPAALLTAIERDAARVAEARSQGFWAALWCAIGGWPAAGGLVAAGLTGLWLGVAPPDNLDSFAGQFLGADMTVDVMGDFADFAEEG